MSVLEDTVFAYVGFCYILLIYYLCISYLVVDLIFNKKASLLMKNVSEYELMIKSLEYELMIKSLEATYEKSNRRIISSKK
jgi:hypothetical protein